MSAGAGAVRAGAARARRTELAVVPRPGSRSKRSEARRPLPLYIGLGLFAGAVVAAILLMQVVLAQSAFDLSDLRKQLQAAEERHEILLLEAAQLDSSARIERYARENLGMVDPGPGGVQYIVADVKQPKRLRDSVGSRHDTTLPTEGVATSDPYASGGP